MGDDAACAAACDSRRGAGDLGRAVWGRIAGAAREPLARSAGGDAARRRGAGLAHPQRLRPDGRGGEAQRRPLRGLVAAHHGGQSRRLHRGRSPDLLSGLRDGQRARLLPDRERRGRRVEPRRRRLPGFHAHRRSGPLDRLRHARGRRAGRQPRHPRRRRRAAGVALARCGARAPHHRLRDEDRARPDAQLDAARLYRGANSRCGGPERRRGQGGNHRPHPLSALGRSLAQFWRGACVGRVRLRLLWRRDRLDPAEPQDRARLFEREPDGGNRRRAGYGSGLRQSRRGGGCGLLCGESRFR